MRNVAWPFLVLLLAAGPAAGDPPTQPPADPAAVTNPAPPAPPRRPRRHCVDDARMGSIMPHQTCFSEEEWQARQAAETARQQRTSDRLSTCMNTDNTSGC